MVTVFLLALGGRILPAARLGKVCWVRRTPVPCAVVMRNRNGSPLWWMGEPFLLFSKGL